MLNYADLVPERFPINEETKFRPDKVFLLKSSGTLTTSIHAHNVSSEGAISSYLGVSDFTITNDFRQAVEKAVRDENIAESYTFSRAAFYSTTIQMTKTAESSTTPLATLSRSLLSLGKQTITFPSSSPHSDHEITIAPVGVGRSSHMFVKDSVPYFWDVVEGGTHWRLHKVVEGRRVRVGELSVRRAYGKDCVVVLDGREIGEVVGLVSCVAVLFRMDSF
ncbi:hypothetical protein LIA77_06495 [Sarocladium implicatum]|nr:hypothetical protein LIA77_06495 [Sarocladium implicatum]